MKAKKEMLLQTLESMEEKVAAIAAAISELKKELTFLDTPEEEVQVVNEEQPEELPASLPEEEGDDDSPTEEDIKDSDLVKEFLKKLPGTKHIMSQIRRVEISNPSSDNGKEMPYLHQNLLQVFAFDKRGEIIYNIGNVVDKTKDGKSIFKVKPIRKNSLPHNIINAMQLRFHKLWEHRNNYQSYVISVEIYD